MGCALLLAVSFWMTTLAMAQDSTTSGTPQNTTEYQTSMLIEKLLEGMDSRVRPHSGGDPVKVTVDFHVTTLGSINEMTMDYTVDIYLRQRWHDDRLMYSEPFKSITLNAGGIAKVWVPDLFFPNEKNAVFHDVTVPNRLLKIFPTGDVLYSLRITLVNSCPMDLSYFPMDRQRCFIKIESYSYDLSDIILEWKEELPIEMNPDLQLPEMELLESRTRTCNTVYSTGEYPCLQASFLLQRQYGFFILQTFIPSILIVVLSWVSFWISPDAVPARISLGVTTVLTMTTQLSGSKVSIPKVSYPKAIDVWMSVCMMFVFTALLEFAFVNALSRKSSNTDEPGETSEKADEANGSLLRRFNPRRLFIRPQAAIWLDNTARVIFPLFFFIFNIVYWSVYLTHTDEELS